MRYLSCIMPVFAFLFIVGLASTAQAQYKASQNRPFENYSRKPSVSPYMNLLNNQNGAATNYQSLVRPQLDQNNFNQQSASAIKNLQRQAANTSQQSKSTHEGNLKLRKTGHAAMRNSYSHYYPGLNK